MGSHSQVLTAACVTLQIALSSPRVPSPGANLAARCRIPASLDRLKRAWNLFLSSHSTGELTNHFSLSFSKHYFEALRCLPSMVLRYRMKFWSSQVFCHLWTSSMADCLKFPICAEDDAPQDFLLWLFHATSSLSKELPELMLSAKENLALPRGPGMTSQPQVLSLRQDVEVCES